MQKFRRYKSGVLRIHPEFKKPKPARQMPVPTKVRDDVWTSGGCWYCPMCDPFDGREAPKTESPSDGRRWTMSFKADGLNPGGDCGVWLHNCPGNDYERTGETALCNAARGHSGRHSFCMVGPDEHPVKRWDAVKPKRTWPPRASASRKWGRDEQGRHG